LKGYRLQKSLYKIYRKTPDLENTWKTSGKHLENTWKTPGKHLEKTPGKHLKNTRKNTWQTPGKHIEKVRKRQTLFKKSSLILLYSVKGFTCQSLMALSKSKLLVLFKNKIIT